MKNLLLIIVFVTILFSCKTPMPAIKTLHESRIETGYGPEDFVLDTFHHRERLLISCAARRKQEPQSGSIAAYYFDGNATKPLTRLGEPSGLQFFPHGIDLVLQTNGAVMLYAVNHEPEENYKKHSVLQYEVKGDTLLFVAQHISPLIVSPNDVAGLPDGSFYVTNDSKHTQGLGLLFEKLFQTRRSTIVYKNPSGVYSIATKKLAYANGIAVRNDTVWIACTFKGELIQYKKNADGSLQKTKQLPGIKGMDNITFFGNDYIVMPSHPSFGKFLKHVKSSEKKSPVLVHLIGIHDNSIKLLYATDGNSISAGSTALLRNDTLYIGQVFDPFLLKVVVE